MGGGVGVGVDCPKIFLISCVPDRLSQNTKNRFRKGDLQKKHFQNEKVGKKMSVTKMG